MAELDSADNIHVDDDNEFFRYYLSRTCSIANDGKHVSHAVLLTNSAAVLTQL